MKYGKAGGYPALSFAINRKKRQKIIAFPPKKSYNGHKRKQNRIKCRAGRSAANKPPHTEGVHAPTAYGGQPRAKHRFIILEKGKPFKVV
jgi:hypothetical protein